MKPIEQVKQQLKALNKYSLMTVKKEIKHLSMVLEENERIVSAAMVHTGIMSGPKLIVLTNLRILVLYSSLNKKVDEKEYIRENMREIEISNSNTIGEIAFKYDYEKETLKLGIILDNAGRLFINNFAQEFNIFDGEDNLKQLPLRESNNKSTSIFKQPNVTLKILNGKEELGYKGFSIEMFQEEKGEVKFRVNGKAENATFIFHHFDRTENIKKNDPLIHSLAGGMWGNSVALGMGLSAVAGKDKSTATLFLTNKETNQPIILVVSCDSRILTKLSKFITAKHLSIAESIPVKPSAIQPDKYDQLEKLGKLRDQGILTEEEFQKEKKRILS